MLLASPGLGAAMAYVTSRLVHDLSAEVAREREIGSYHLVERLGTGAMGEVWRADHSMLARAAAVKVIRTQALTVDSIEDARNVVNLFELEAQATAALTSPHTIDVYDFGYTKEGLFYYVMELLDGFDLQTLVERDGRQPPERVAHILRQAAESLHEAHEMNYVHRDLKPANIFMCRYGGDVDFAKLLDFGLVLDRNASLEEEDPGVPEPDAGVKLIGTPSVMAPEMLDPHAKIDGRADIYGLGCVGYWLLTGERVFPAETRIAMLRAHARATPQAPSERAGVQIPAELEQLVLECLRKRPGERPQSALEVSERITGLGLANDWDRSRRNRWWDNNATGPLQDRLDR